MVITAGKIFFDFCHESFEGLPTDDLEKVVVISFFGKSLQDAEGIKNSNFTVFKSRSSRPILEGYYDSNQNTIYLHLKGILDVHNLIETLNDLSSALVEKGYLTTWANLKRDYARALLFLFAVSHVIVVCHPVPTFDLSYIHLFRALDSVRAKAFEKVSSVLNHRPCTPRLLFRFDSCPKTVKDIKKLEHSLEDQIYHILRKCKIISNLSANSLFAIPVNQEFVFIETKPARPANRVNQMVNNIVANCLNSESRLTVLDYLTVEHELKQVQQAHTFQRFLSAHVDLALTKGFDDNVGRHLTPAPFRLLTPGTFWEVASKAHRILVKEPTEPVSNETDGMEDLLDLLRDHLDVDAKFSEGRCCKVLPLALATYQQNAPFHYTREYHETRLSQAMTVLALHGRGSMVDKYAAQLEKECLKHWQNGRQMCQVPSLTGNPCTNALHKGGSDEAMIDPASNDCVDRKQEGLEVKEHSSGVRYVSTCNCGRRQAPRQDPYTLKAANNEFYTLLAEECGCDEFDVIKFPIFQPSTRDFKAAQLLNPRRESIQKSDSSNVDASVAMPRDPFGLVHVSGCQSGGGGSDVILDPRLSGGCLQKDPETVVHVTNENDGESDKVKQPSTTEYLPTMLHTESPAGLLPQFSSWSLVCLGPSSLYSHNLGLQDQPGFIPGSSYLLPWDVTVRLDQNDKKSTWSNVGDFRKNPMRVRKSKGDQSEFVVKIFVGVEYECPRGHRFMAAGPDKVLKTSNCGQVKDNGQKVTSTDMPIYVPCVCSRSNKQLIAQLMRVHIVTPKAPVRVTLNPKVQPAPNAPIFVATNDQPIPLTQSAYWVLRLPYVYMGERSPYLPPQDQPLSHQGRFLAGCYGITEILSQ